MELDYRLRKKGYKLIFNPKAIVYHYRPKDWKSFSKMMYRYGWVQGVLVRKYGIFRKIQTLPVLSISLVFLFLIVLMVNKTIAFWFIFTLTLLVLLYLLDIILLGLFLSGVISWHGGFMAGLIKGTVF